MQSKYKENIEKIDKYTKDSNKFYTDFTEKFSDLKRKNPEAKRSKRGAVK